MGVGTLPSFLLPAWIRLPKEKTQILWRKKWSFIGKISIIKGEVDPKNGKNETRIIPKRTKDTGSKIKVYKLTLWWGIVEWMETQQATCWMCQIERGYLVDATVVLLARHTCVYACVSVLFFFRRRNFSVDDRYPRIGTHRWQGPRCSILHPTDEIVRRTVISV